MPFSVRIPAIVRRLLSVAVAVGLALPPAVATADTGAAKTAPLALTFAPRGKKKKAAEPATDGKTIALMRFSGDPVGNDLRENIKIGLEEGGYKVKSVALEMSAAAKKVKCKDDALSDKCADAVGKWLNASPKTAADYLVYANVDAGPTKRADVIVYDVSKGEQVKKFTPSLGTEDLIVSIALPQAIVTGLNHHIEPPPEATEEEKKVIAALDEPEKTPEEIQAEKDALAKVEDEATKVGLGQAAKIEDVPVDLRKDFKAFCRKGKRTPRKSRDDPKDLRPKCQRGPVFGYWQPRAWVALGLTAGLALGTIAFYSLALAARSPYKDAVDALDAHAAEVGGDGSKDPNVTGDQRYVELATEVSSTGALMRRRAIVGDVLLGATVLVGAVMAIIIFQDRRDAKRFIKEEKQLKQAEGATSTARVKDVKVGPILTKDQKGVGVSLRF